ncbi:ADP-ribose diphosphatase [Elasticomyces elasticus]|uniref:ADP-ribose diphosphatase n=2 Tax=Exophiala sideris TaxID=1016849 RepID=A0ABR0JKQ8_9EURO|nr:ADP-ribose diphosphatase [Elasticomyces elasticus]KAK5032198.1 ADP-ribose diphosphatase [Exophiala sideris]KAK5036196.1 ADP-ribose diphosphatase [Exophiala sideris]KAK5066579.1 ADP-ribose diphosphatase [Exophiala sideris]KAK5180401.1 ADP-ribose diphosphatase [Eurotiomycetes sp. CCFEE 6388]
MADKMSTYSPLDAKVTSVEPMKPGDSKWITLKKITYKDPSGKQRLWESAERMTRSKNSEVDAVGVVAVLNDPKSSKGPSLLLQKQFRPAVDKVTIEVPSGLIDEGEDPATAALRELKEETGYIATIPGDAKAAEGFLMFNDPGFCNTNTKMIFVEVDMSDSRNQEGNRKPELEDSEYIECFTVPLDNMWNELAQLEEQGFAIDARVGTLAQGMEMARKWKEVFTKSPA